MIVVSTSKINLDFFFRWFDYIFGIVATCLALVLSFFLIHSYNRGRLSSVFEEKDKEVSNLSYYAFEEIGKGALSLNGFRRGSSVPDLTKEILVVARNSRPDCSLQDMKLLIALKSTKEQRIANHGSQIFLRYERNERDLSCNYYFSNEKTPLWIKPRILEKKGILIEVGHFSPSKESEAFMEEKAQFVVHESSMQMARNKESSFYEKIKGAHLWGVDVLIKEYGGKDFFALKTKQKVEIPTDKGTSFNFLSSGDYLSWHDGKWNVVSLQEARKDCPLALVKSFTTRAIEIEVWDENGFFPRVFKIELEPTQKSPMKVELPTQIRLRTAKQVTCNLGKRRYILKEGDWLLKTARGWRHLRRSQEIDDLLAHKMKGELFIFDSIEKQQGKYFLKGHIFDDMRMQVQSVSLPITSENISSPKKVIPQPPSRLERTLPEKTDEKAGLG